MLRNVTRLKGFTIRARDGDMGIVDQFYFDDESWAIRYLVVNTGDWLGVGWCWFHPSPSARRIGNPGSLIWR